MAHVIIHGEHSLTAKLHRVPSIGEHVKVRSPSPSLHHFPDGEEHLVVKVTEVELVDAELSHINQDADAYVQVTQVNADT